MNEIHQKIAQNILDRLITQRSVINKDNGNGGIWYCVRLSDFDFTIHKLLVNSEYKHRITLLPKEKDKSTLEPMALDCSTEIKDEILNKVLEFWDSFHNKTGEIINTPDDAWVKKIIGEK